MPSVGIFVRSSVALGDSTVSPERKFSFKLCKYIYIPNLCVLYVF